MNTNPTSPNPFRRLVRPLMALGGLTALLVVGLLLTLMLWLNGSATQPVALARATSTPVSTATSTTPAAQPKPAYWHPPGDSQLPAGEAGRQVSYGRELVAHTAKYLGPAGSVRHLSNGMNCQNCHLDAGTKVLGNNYSAVFSTYPKYRERSGTKETIVKRIRDCFERSLNGRSPDSSSREMRAMVAYMKWLGTGVPKGDKPNGAGLEKLAYLDRAASPDKGKLVYTTKCQSCHGAKGEGITVAGDAQYTYPPLWGPHSYNDGAGLFRLSNFAGYVKNNMPFGASYESPMLTDAEAWDVAAFINSMPRPHRDQRHDWPKPAAKPVDFPFAPYADSFSEKQHKYGPYPPIADAKKKATKA
ncbi:c-type cytochrome [Spirosoma linguale]|uniref:Cytochrome c class I n=1 Tax=Spirosoma linguale (strain ATCC 33905 / DSM 74 / LMG 10896 / Claus 1) TaxID=504472 RepID=D2QVQ9_SPILD|nr:cytochrome c class I [Spirosoma linguale DSM 74]